MCWHLCACVFAQVTAQVPTSPAGQFAQVSAQVSHSVGESALEVTLWEYDQSGSAQTNGVAVSQVEFKTMKGA